MSNDQSIVTPSDLFHELVLDAEHPTPGFLRRLVTEHPQHAKALAQFAEDLMLDGDPNVEVDDMSLRPNVKK